MSPQCKQDLTHAASVQTGRDSLHFLHYVREPAGLQPISASAPDYLLYPDQTSLFHPKRSGDGRVSRIPSEADPADLHRILAAREPLHGNLHAVPVLFGDPAGIDPAFSVLDDDPGIFILDQSVEIQFQLAVLGIIFGFSDGKLAFFMDRLLLYLCSCSSVLRAANFSLHPNNAENRPFIAVDVINNQEARER